MGFIEKCLNRIGYIKSTNFKENNIVVDVGYVDRRNFSPYELNRKMCIMAFEELIKLSEIKTTEGKTHIKFYTKNI